MSDDIREQLARAMTAHHTVPWDEMPDIRKSRFLAYADAALAEFVGVRVSPLEWTAKGYAQTPFGKYLVVREDWSGQEDFWFVCFAGKPYGKCGDHSSEKAAKAAAQADCEARILAAIEPAPVSTDEQSSKVYCYNRNDWENTFEWDDRDTLVEHLMPGEIMEVGTLTQGPTLWVVECENAVGDRETRWFDNEAEARVIAEGKE